MKQEVQMTMCWAITPTSFDRESKRPAVKLTSFGSATALSQDPAFDELLLELEEYGAHWP